MIPFIMSELGFIGIGAMGGQMTNTLLREFHRMKVFDLDRRRVERAVQGGATAGKDVPEIARNCRIIFLSLPKSEICIEVVEKELFPHLQPGSTVIDLGTTVVEETQRICSLLETKDCFFLDAPVSGGVGGSAKGSLFVFVGGDREAARKQWNLLRDLGGGRLTYCGPSGSGQVTKAVNQLAMGLVDAAYSEAVAFGVAAGVDPAVLLNAVGGDGGFRKGFEGIAGKIVAGQGDFLDNKFAEYEYFLREADRRDFSAPILRGLHQFIRDLPATHRDNMDRPYAPYWSAMFARKPKEEGRG